MSKLQGFLLALTLALMAQGQMRDPVRIDAMPPFGGRSWCNRRRRRGGPLDLGARIVLRQPRQQIVDLRPRRHRQRTTRLTLRV